MARTIQRPLVHWRWLCKGWSKRFCCLRHSSKLLDLHFRSQGAWASQIILTPWGKSSISATSSQWNIELHNSVSSPFMTAQSYLICVMGTLSKGRARPVKGLKGPQTIAENSSHKISILTCIFSSISKLWVEIYLFVIWFWSTILWCCFCLPVFF